MGHTTNYPKDIFEQIDIELCRDERMLHHLGNARTGIFPIYDETHLPRGLREGDAFNTTQGRFCVIHNNAMYCMPAAAVGIGPLIWAIQKQTPVSWGGGGTADLWELAALHDSGQEIVFRSSPNFHCASPVWGTDFKNVIYQEHAIPNPSLGTAQYFTTRLCMHDVTSGDRTFLHDSGVMPGGSNSTRIYYYNYSMSPDGQKVAFLTPFGNSPLHYEELRCCWADGSGDCGAGAMFNGPYGNPEWSADSQTIYITAADGINGFDFQTGAASTVWTSQAIDYFWLSNDKTRFVTAWYDNPDSFLIIINMNGTVNHAYSDSDVPWHSFNRPTEVFWAPDDSFLVLCGGQGNNNAFGSVTGGGRGTAVKVNPNNLSDWSYYPWPTDGSVTDRGIVNWTLALGLDGKMKVMASCFDNDYSIQGIAIYQWDAETCNPEGFVLRGAWNNTFPIWDRYTLGGLASCTAFYGTQIWDV